MRSPRSAERRGELVRAIARDRAFRWFLASSLLGALVYAQFTATLPLQVVDRGFSYGFFGLLLSVNGIVIVLLELPLTAVTQRYPPRPVLFAGALLTALGFGLTAVAANAPLLAATVVIWTLGEIVWSPVASAYVADLAPLHLRGRYQGAWGLTFGLAFVVAPIAGTALYAESSTLLWAACGLVGALSAVLLLRGPGPVERQG